jgi:hypothetical protein
MTGLPAHSPVQIDPCEDCVAGESPGFPRYRSGESKWTGQHVRQRVQIAVRSLVRAYQREQRCSPGIQREFRIRAPRNCATLSGLARESKRMRCCAAAKRAQLLFRGRIAGALTITIAALRIIIRTHCDGSCQVALLGKCRTAREAPP